MIFFILFQVIAWLAWCVLGVCVAFHFYGITRGYEMEDEFKWHSNIFCIVSKFRNED